MKKPIMSEVDTDIELPAMQAPEPQPDLELAAPFPSPGGHVRAVDVGCLRGELKNGKIRVFKTDTTCNCTLDLENMDQESAKKISAILAPLSQ